MEVRSLLVLEIQINNFLTLGRETGGLHPEQKVPCTLYRRLPKEREAQPESACPRGRLFSCHGIFLPSQLQVLSMRWDVFLTESRFPSLCIENAECSLDESI